VEERKILGEYVTMRTRSVRFDKRRGAVTVLIDDGFLREADPTAVGHRAVLIDEWAFHHLMAHKELLVVSAAEEDQGSARKLLRFNRREHFLRIARLEKPICSVADAIGGVNLPKGIELSTWGQIHREINNKVTSLRNAPHTVARDEEIAFYSILDLEFGYFNDIWRRFVAHSRESYDAPQAKSAMGHVAEFVGQAAKKGLKELP
jgi:hypothetical protein